MLTDLQYEVLSSIKKRRSHHRAFVSVPAKYQGCCNTLKRDGLIDYDPGQNGARINAHGADAMKAHEERREAKRARDKKRAARPKTEGNGLKTAKTTKAEKAAKAAKATKAAKAAKRVKPQPVITDCGVQTEPSYEPGPDIEDVVGDTGPSEDPYAAE